MHTDRIRLIAVLFAILVTAVACQSILTLPTSAQLRDAGVAGEDVDLAVLDRGRALTITACDSCHRVYWPAEHTPEEWAELVGPMAGLASLSTEDAGALSAYLRAASTAAAVRPDAQAGTNGQ